MTEQQSTGPNYDVMYEGRLVVGRNPVQVQRQFAGRFGDQVAKRVFSQPRVILKRSVPRPEAIAIQRQLEDIGMSVTLIPSVQLDTAGLSLEDGEPTPRPLAPRARPVSGDIAGQARRAPRTEAEKPYTLAEIDAGFHGQPTHPPTSPGYLLRLIPVALAMVLLPTLYVAIVGAGAWLLLQLAVAGLAWAAAEPTQASLRWPLLAAGVGGGLLALFFFLRPLAPIGLRRPAPVRAEATREAALHHLVRRIASATGAPEPGEILLDASVNASARLTHGPFSRSLTLTIGMPLLHGLDVATLAGVIAHELGHFRQRLGMRLASVIESINAWF